MDINVEGFVISSVDGDAIEVCHPNGKVIYYKNTKGVEYWFTHNGKKITEDEYAALYS